MAHLRDNGSICPISNINCAFVIWCTANQRFSSFKRMNMVLEYSHNFIFIKIWNPMEEAKQESLWVTVKCLTNTIKWNMVIYKFNLVSITLKVINHILFLPSKIIQFITHGINAYSQNREACNLPAQMWNP